MVNDFEGDLDGFFEDFGTELKFGSLTSKVIFDKPDQLLFGGEAIGAEYQITFKSSELTDLENGSEITINSTDYTVREIRKLDDGLTSIAMLNKV